MSRSSRCINQTTLKVNLDNPNEIYENTAWMGYLFGGIGGGVLLVIAGAAIKIWFNWW